MIPVNRKALVLEPCEEDRYEVSCICFFMTDRPKALIETEQGYLDTVDATNLRMLERGNILDSMDLSDLDIDP